MVSLHSHHDPKNRKQTTTVQWLIQLALGADGYSALSQTQCCDMECINKQDANTHKKITERTKYIKATLTLVSKYKEWCKKNSGCS